MTMYDVIKKDIDDADGFKFPLDHFLVGGFTADSVVELIESSKNILVKKATEENLSEELFVSQLSLTL